MINIIWALFIIIGIGYSLAMGDLNAVNVEILNSAKTSFDMILTMLPIIALWLGIMTIAKDSGLLDKLASFFAPVLSFLFPEIPKGHESLGFISSNIIINLFGLGNVATPFGLKAMESLQTLNKQKDTATRSMITFLVLNTSGLSIIPTTVISLRVMHNSTAPMEIIGVVIVASLISTVFGLIIDRIWGKVCDNR
ncbi:MAG: nucleoside recognition domain-containing protein [Bacilli bacterium]|nr:nucleoside recognition domain-containing protein [Bacilli bacterium]MDD3304829.1 nucleoside recognition domain-containing protein [Bacilli bacterium]MDD4053416.1 nucleoside recognition domain-containing protein [Bacilli bacterium]MDD4410937.1 nucleoside recognition domain-containing protein [Bacilli bacterium]